MSGYAAASPQANAAYVPPGGNAAVAVGKATFHFLQGPMTFQVWQFLGIAFLIFLVARHWGRFVNEL